MNAGMSAEPERGAIETAAACGPGEASWLFDDPGVVELLAHGVFPAIFEKKNAGDAVRIWVPICGRGEDAYSLAILLQEILARSREPLRFQIFATDLDPNNVSRARAAVYPAAIAGRVSAARLAEFFFAEGDGYRVRSDLRQACIFATHDLVRDPPFGHLDLIACRRLPAHRCNELVPRFHHALNPLGFLLLDPARWAGAPSGLFSMVSDEHGIARRADVATPLVPALSSIRAEESAARRANDGRGPWRVVRGTPSEPFEQIFLERLVPPSAILDERGDVRFLAGKVSPYLQPPAGGPSVNVLDLARADIRPALGAAVRLAVAEHREVVREGLAVKLGDAWHRFDLAVRPLPELAQPSPSFLLVFHEVRPPGEEDATAGADLEETPADGLAADLQLANEELRASNEDLASANEELRAALDELEATREALASANLDLEDRLQELHASHALVQDLFASTELAAVFADPALRLTHFTPAAAELLRLIPADVGRPVLDLAALAHPGLAGEIDEVIRTGKPREQEVFFQGGERRFVRTIRPRRTSGGAVDGAVITFVDVTSLRRAEQARRASETMYQRVVDLVPSMLWAADASGTITYANEQWYAYTGLPTTMPPAEQFAAILHPDDRDAFLQAWDAARRGGTRFEAETRRRGADGTYRWFLVRATPVRDEAGAVLGWFGASVDIHDQRLGAELRAADQRKNELLAVLAHDLRNPLSVVQQAAHALGRSATPESSAQLSAMIGRQVSRMTRMIEDLLDVSRIREGKVTLKREPLDLTALVRAAAEDERPLMESHQLTFEVELPPHPVPIVGDETRLSQVAGNLLHNARKFTDAGGRVRLSLRHRRGDPRATLTVEDTGIGIAAEMLPRLFEAFTQADDSRSRSGGGLGLGLSLVRGLVALHGGSVRAESAGRRQGATFRVELPVRDEAAGALEPRALPAPAPVGAPAIAPDPPSGRPLRVLLVEDNLDVLEPLQITFELQGYEVAAADSGAEALAVAAAFRPEVVICDIGLPGLNGYEVARALCADSAARPAHLIALTSFTSAEDKAKAADAGFDLHLCKPLDPDDVERIVRNLSRFPRT
jgi:two-component system CheB/CheR fusion protein